MYCHVGVHLWVSRMVLGPGGLRQLRQRCDATGVAEASPAVCPGSDPDVLSGTEADAAMAACFEFDGIFFNALTHLKCSVRRPWWGHRLHR